ncbi:hypothetical protein KYK29_06575 [Shinella daejeonensis]|uniref:hypothetical protein n=1 Tax=Shinella daejeonensis TaxID=659017 RepID=UPI0020C7883C|nr:hypothetical protein [Shinella daejeonensis]MCP8894592.1 hypothetical protein [Shinella daejeonensis]
MCDRRRPKHLFTGLIKCDCCGDGLDKHLMEPELFKDFCEKFTREVNRARMDARVSIEVAGAEIKKSDRELEKILDLYLKNAMTVGMVK